LADPPKVTRSEADKDTARINSFIDKHTAATEQGKAARMIVKDATSDAEAAVTMGENSAEEIRSKSPKNLSKILEKEMAETAELNKSYQNSSPLNPFQSMCSGSRMYKMGRFLVRDYPIEMINFNIALGLVAMTSMADDPATLRHFFEANVKDPMAAASFLGFVAGSRFTTWAMQAANLAFDPCRMVNYTPSTMTVQKYFRPLVGPLALAGGSLFFGLAHEFLTDQNVWTCASGFGKKLSAHETKMRNEACETAYESWAVTHKINQYLPQIASMGLVSTIQAYGINKLLTAAGVGGRPAQLVTIALRTIGIASYGGVFLGPHGWVVREAVSIGGSFIFLYLDQKVLHPIVAPPLERRYNGNEISDRIKELKLNLDRAEKNRWAWTPLRPSYCDYKPTAEERVFGYEEPWECIEPVASPGTLVRRLGVRQKGWRDYLLKEAYIAQQNWSEYLMNFSESYQASFQFYRSILAEIAFNRYHSSTPQGYERSVLYATAPANGLRLNFPSDTDNAGIRSAFQVTLQKALAIARYELGARETGKIKALTGDIDALRKIVRGLEGADLSEESPEAERTVNIMLRLAPALDKYDRDSLEWKARETNFNEAMLTLSRMAQLRRPPLGIIRDPNEPFAKIKAALGSPKPMAEGMEALAILEENPQVVPPAFRLFHPQRLGVADTPNAADYLLASMVCGPGPAPDRTKERTEQMRTDFFKASYYIPGLFNMGPVKKEKEDQMVKEVAELYGYMTANDESPTYPRGPYRNGPAAEDLIKKTSWKYTQLTFQPPKIINDLGVSLCDQLPDSQKYKSPAFNLPAFNIHDNVWKINGVEYKGFLDIVKKNVRNDVFGPDAKDFPTWWAKHIDPHVLGVLTGLRGQYDRIVEEKFAPAMIKSGENAFGDFKLQSGVINSLMEDARYNVDLLERLLIRSQVLPTNPDPKANPEFRAKKLLIEVMRRMRLATSLLGTEESKLAAMLEIKTGQPVFAGDVKNNFADRKNTPPYKQLAQTYQTLKTQMAKNPGVQFRDYYAANKLILRQLLSQLDEFCKLRLMEPTMLEVSQAAVVNLALMMTETDNYFSLLNTVAINGLE
jgi:hypothetical protein